ncbi:MAG TPA: hypothetical protein VK588_06135 [Chitinophagaceae bacterium]|nr:hypothetical protein [Chitinophagaceae bacterium]
MNLEYSHLLDKNFHPNSRVWIYQSNRLFSINEALQIEDMLSQFIHSWNSHGAPVKGEAHLFFGQFVVLIADETATGVSGCSTDSSVRLIKEIEKTFTVTLFDRTTLAFVVKDKIQLLPLQQVQHAVNTGSISNETLYFNNLVPSKKELETNWIIPLKDSWLAKRVSFAGTIS